MGDQRRPDQGATDDRVLVREVLAGELESTTLIARVEQHRAGDLGQVVVDAQLGLQTQRVLDDEHVAQALVVDIGPDLVDERHDPLADVLLDMGVQARADGRQ